jgi:hypothetical protein
MLGSSYAILIVSLCAVPVAPAFCIAVLFSKLDLVEREQYFGNGKLAPLPMWTGVQNLGILQ